MNKISSALGFNKEPEKPKEPTKEDILKELHAQSDESSEEEEKDDTIANFVNKTDKKENIMSDIYAGLSDEDEEEEKTPE